MTDNEILQSVQEDNANEVEENLTMQPVHTIEDNNAMNAVNVCIKWAAENYAITAYILTSEQLPEKFLNYQSKQKKQIHNN